MAAKYGGMVKRYRPGNPEVIGEKSLSVTMCPSQIPDYVGAWDGTPTFVTTARKLTAPIPPAATAPSGPWRSHCREFTITIGHNIFGRTPLDE